MEIINELHYRISIASDFLAKMLESDVFQYTNGNDDKKKTPITHKLLAISSLLSASKFLNRISLNETANKTFETHFKNKICQDMTCSFLHDGEKSFTHWNAICSVILFKQGNFTLSREFTKSLVACVNKNRILPTYPAGKSNKDSAKPGLVMLAMLQNHGNLANAYKCAEIMLHHGVGYEPQEIWSMLELAKYYDDNRYGTRIRRTLNIFKDVSPDMMSSLIASFAQQCLVACEHTEYFETGYAEKQDKILKQQISLQVDDVHDWSLGSEFIGAFVKNSISKQIRIDYVASNLLSMIQYLCNKQNRDIPKI